MIRRPRIRPAVLVAAALLAVAGPLVVAAAPAAAAPTRPVQDGAEAGGTPETPSSDEAILRLVGCVQGTRRLAVSILIDESASLKGTDPENRRVDAALAALDSLSSLAGGSGEARTRVDVSIAAFSNRYREIRDWTAVGPSTNARLRASIDGFRTRNRGTDTDFLNALEGGRKALADRSAAITASGDAAPCKAILLFTDGQYDIAVRDADNIERLGRTKSYAPGIELTDEAAVREVEEAGRRELCREGGVADEVRGDDITLLTVALSGDLSADAQRLLASVSAGTADGVVCGTPLDVSPGAYLAASDVDVLIDRFDEVATRLAGGTLLPGQPREVCGASACEEGRRTFQLDASVKRVHLLALAPEPGVQVLLTGPEGSATISKAGRTPVGDVTADVRSVAGRGYTIDLVRPSGDSGWAGTWTAALVDPSGDQAGSPGTLQVYVFSEIGVRLGELGEVRRGEDLALSAELVLPEGVSAAELVSAASASVSLEDPVAGTTEQVALTGPAEGPFTGTFAIPDDFRSSAYLASVELRATTDDGAEVVTRSAPQSLLVLRPDGAIQVAPASIDMPSLTGSGSTEGDLVLIGAEEAGCVWFGDPEVDLPEGAGDLELTYDGESASSRASCIEVPSDGNLTVVVEASPADRATGSARGVLEVHELVDGGTESVTLVPFQFDMARGVDEARRNLLGAAMLLGGLLLPVLLLLLINALTARFQDLAAVQGTVLPVRIQGTDIFRTDDTRHRPFRLLPADFGSLAGAGSSRRFVFGGVQFRAQASRNPFGGTIAMAAPEGGAEKLKGRVGSKVELDPGLAGSWVFLLDPDRTRRDGMRAAEGNLIVFLAEGGTQLQVERVLPDIHERLPETAGRLAGLVREQPARRSKKATRAAAADPAAGTGPNDQEPTGDQTEHDLELGSAEAAVADEPEPMLIGDADEPSAADAPAAPLGFGGRAAVPPPAGPASATDDTDDTDDDAPPAAPPVGFGGAPRPVDPDEPGDS